MKLKIYTQKNKVKSLQDSYELEKIGVNTFEDSILLSEFEFSKQHIIYTNDGKIIIKICEN